MDEYIGRNADRVVVRNRRPSFAMAVLFVFAIGLIVWLMIPANHGWISFNTPTPTTTTPLAKAPAGSVSGAATAVGSSTPRPAPSSP
jgi:hypothetical protein